MRGRDFSVAAPSAPQSCACGPEWPISLLFSGPSLPHAPPVSSLPRWGDGPPATCSCSRAHPACCLRVCGSDVTGLHPGCGRGFWTSLVCSINWGSWAIQGVSKSKLSDSSSPSLCGLWKLGTRDPSEPSDSPGELPRAERGTDTHPQCLSAGQILARLSD